MTNEPANRNAVKELLCMFREDTVCQLMDEEEIEKAAPFFELVEYAPGTVVFREGDLGDFLGFVISGKLEVKKETEFKGKQIIVAILGSRSFVGELSIFDLEKRSATVEAIEATQMLLIRHDALEAFLEKYPHTGIKMLKVMIRILSIRLRRATERLAAIF